MSSSTPSVKPSVVLGAVFGGGNKPTGHQIPAWEKSLTERGPALAQNLAARCSDVRLTEEQRNILQQHVENLYNHFGTTYSGAVTAMMEFVAAKKAVEAVRAYGEHHKSVTALMSIKNMPEDRKLAIASTLPSVQMFGPPTVATSAAVVPYAAAGGPMFEELDVDMPPRTPSEARPPSQLYLTTPSHSPGSPVGYPFR